MSIRDELKPEWAKRFVKAYLKLYKAGKISKDILLKRTRELRRKYNLMIDWERLDVTEKS